MKPTIYNPIKDKKNLVMTVAKYLENKNARDNFTFRITPNGSYYVKNDVIFSEAEVHGIYPLPVSLLTRLRINKNHDWLHD